MESGQAVLLAAPIISLGGALVAAGYAKLWQPLAPSVRFSWRPTLVALIVLTVLCGGIVFYPPGTGEWVGIALWFVGTSYLTLQLLVLRITLSSAARHRYSLLSLAPWLVLYLPALVLAYAGSATEELALFPLIWMWTLPGYGGWVLLPVSLALFVEVVIRRKRLADRLRRELLPRPLPEARARMRPE